MTKEIVTPAVISFDLLETAQPIVREEAGATRIPRVGIPQATTNPMNIGKFEIEKDVTYVSSIRVWLIDGEIRSRTYFRTTEGGGWDSTTKDPACGSSNGISPRPFYNDKTVSDWRTKNLVVIDSNPESKACLNCPLSKWQPVYNGGAGGKSTSSAPVCQETPQFVVYDFDTKSLRILQASNYTSRLGLLGMTVKQAQGYGIPSAVPGLNAWFSTQPGKVSPLYEVKEGGAIVYPLLLTLKVFPPNASRMGNHVIPTMAKGANALTAEEFAEMSEAKKRYMDDQIDGFTQPEILRGLNYQLPAPETNYPALTAPTSRADIINDSPF